MTAVQLQRAGRARGLVEAALGAAGLGLPVFPLLPRGKTPAIRSAHAPGNPCRGQCGRHGHGFHDATTDPDVIRAWWQRWIEANYGIAPGPARLVVVDLDTGKGTPPPGGPGKGGVLAAQGTTLTPAWVRDGADVLTWIAQQDGLTRGELDAALATFTVTTLSGGRHLYYAAPPDGINCEPVRSSVGCTTGRITGVGWCIDIRADGGYVVGPGSLGPHATAYTVTRPGPFLPLPAFLAARIAAIGARTTPASPVPAPPRPATAGTRAQRFWQAALDGELAHIAAAHPGAKDGTGRNATTNRAAYKLGRLADAYLDPDGQETLAEQLVAAAVATGLPEREARTAVASGLAAGRQRPRGPSRGRR